MKHVLKKNHIYIFLPEEKSRLNLFTVQKNETVTQTNLNRR